MVERLMSLRRRDFVHARLLPQRRSGERTRRQ